MGTEIQMNLSAKLISLRKQKGLTQMDLAEKLNVSRQAISRWEVGTAVPSTDNLKVLSELYGVTVDYLLNELNDGTVQIHEERAPISVSKNHTPKTRKSMMLLLFVVDAIVAAVIASILTVASIQNKNQNQVVPIEDLNVGQGDYTTYTFSFDKSP